MRSFPPRHFPRAGNAQDSVLEGRAMCKRNTHTEPKKAGSKSLQTEVRRGDSKPSVRGARACHFSGRSRLMKVVDGSTLCSIRGFGSCHIEKPCKCPQVRQEGFLPSANHIPSPEYGLGACPVSVLFDLASILKAIL